MADKLEIEISLKNAADTEKQLKKIKDGVEDTGKAAKKTEQQAEGAFKKMGSSVIKFADIVKAYIVTKVLVALKDLVLNSYTAFTEFDQLSRATAQQFGKSADEIIKKLKEMSGGTISDTELIKQANKAMALGVTTDIGKMADLLEFARLRAQAMGIDTTFAFDSIVTGIGRGSPLILDNLGIITKGWAEEAAAAGVAYDNQFILNKVLQQAALTMQGVGRVMDTEAEKAQKAKTAFENLKIAIGSRIEASNFINNLTLLSNKIAELIGIKKDDNKALDEYISILKTLSGTEIKKVVSEKEKYRKQISDEITQTKLLIENLNKQRDSYSFTDKITKKYFDTKNALTEAEKILISKTKEYENVNRDLNIAIDISKTKTDKLTTAKKAEVKITEEESKAINALKDAYNNTLPQQKIYYENLLKTATNAKLSSEQLQLIKDKIKEIDDEMQGEGNGLSGLKNVLGEIGGTDGALVQSIYNMVELGNASEEAGNKAEAAWTKVLGVIGLVKAALNELSFMFEFFAEVAGDEGNSKAEKVLTAISKILTSMATGSPWKVIKAIRDVVMGGREDAAEREAAGETGAVAAQAEKENNAGRVIAGILTSGISEIPAVRRLTDRIRGRATGGAVSGNEPYMVGERGPEMFLPSQNGSIIPSHNVTNNKGMTFNNVTIKADNPEQFFDQLQRYQRQHGVLA